LQNLENKGDNLQDLQNAGVMASLELVSAIPGRHKPEAVDSVPTLVQLYAGCQVDEAAGVSSEFGG
jgi:hypothetical protein